MGVVRIRIGFCLLFYSSGERITLFFRSIINEKRACKINNKGDS